MSYAARSVSLEDLTKVFIGPEGQQIIAADDIALTIGEGELVTFLGPSGCGKTTTLRMIAGFEQPTGGKVFIGERDVTSVPPNMRDTAMVFQSYALFPHMTVGENIAYGLRFRSLGAAERNERVSSIMELVGLTGLETRQPGQLSGGQQQRVALARALIVEPQVLLFDEPLSNLDAKLREQMREEIRRIQQRLSITSIYVTHDQAEAMAISDRIVIMNHGRVEQVGTPQEVYGEPSSKFVADFIGRVNFLPGRLISRATVPASEASDSAAGRPDSSDGWKAVGTGRDLYMVDLFGHEVLIEGKQGLESQAAASDGKILVVCRPEAATIEGSAEHIGALAYTAGRITKAVYFGSYMEYGFELDGAIPFTLIDHNPARTVPLSVGDVAGIRFDARSMHALAYEE